MTALELGLQGLLKLENKKFCQNVCSTPCTVGRLAQTSRLVFTNDGEKVGVAKQLSRKNAES